MKPIIALCSIAAVLFASGCASVAPRSAQLTYSKTQVVSATPAEIKAYILSSGSWILDRPQVLEDTPDHFYFVLKSDGGGSKRSLHTHYTFSAAPNGTRVGVAERAITETSDTEGRPKTTFYDSEQPAYTADLERIRIHFFDRAR